MTKRSICIYCFGIGTCVHCIKVLQLFLLLRSTFCSLKHASTASLSSTLAKVVSRNQRELLNLAGLHEAPEYGGKGSQSLSNFTAPTEGCCNELARKLYLWQHYRRSALFMNYKLVETISKKFYANDLHPK